MYKEVSGILLNQPDNQAGKDNFPNSILQNFYGITMLFSGFWQ